MSITKSLFGTLDGENVYSFVLDNGKGLKAEIINYGGIIRKLIYKNTDVVLGRDSLDEYLKNNGYFGALIGRNSNRIENAEFEIDGTVYKLFQNDGQNNLHGGKIGFDKKIWNAEEVDGAEPSLVLSLTSPDGEEGFPGETKVKVTYTLTSDNGIKIHYEAVCDKDTVFNMTNHSYFNLNGHASGTVDNHFLQMNSSFFTPNSMDCVPTGEVLKTEGTPFDFRKGHTLKEGFESGFKDIEMFSGYDHSFALDGRGFRLCASVIGDKSGIKMEMYTDRPAVQLYTGNSIQKDRICKDGAVYSTHHALCLETQVFPNNMKFSHFPCALLKKGERYDTVTEYRFI